MDFPGAIAYLTEMYGAAKDMPHFRSRFGQRDMALRVYRRAFANGSNPTLDAACDRLKAAMDPPVLVLTPQVLADLRHIVEAGPVMREKYEFCKALNQTWP